MTEILVVLIVWYLLLMNLGKSGNELTRLDSHACWQGQFDARKYEGLACCVSSEESKMLCCPQSGEGVGRWLQERRSSSRMIGDAAESMDGCGESIDASRCKELAAEAQQSCQRALKHFGC